MRAPGHVGLDGDALRVWWRAVVRDLRAAREEIDDLNVYPVPDGDTGTNLTLTAESAAAALAALPDGAGADDVLRALGRGTLLGARGNSGVILSQLVRGMAGELAGLRAVDAGSLAGALRRAADEAYTAVGEPVEGTILTVARAAADGAERAARQGAALAAAARAAAVAAAEALRRTPEQLDVLRRAGVVDAGGRGLCVVLDALADALGGAPRGADDDGAPAVAEVADVSSVPVAAPTAGPFEVTYLLGGEGGRDVDRADAARLRARLNEIGDSVVVVGGGEDGWAVHVHTADAGAAVEAGLAVGRPHRIAVVGLGGDAPAGDGPSADARHYDGPAPDEDGGGPASAGGRRAVVAVAAGPGIAALLRRGGAVVVEGGPAGRASTRDLLDAVERSGAREVVLVPNDPGGVAVADAAAREARRAGRRVAVVPTRTTVQAIAALAVADPGRGFDDDVIAMTAAGRACRHGAVTVAAREAVTSAGVCRPGDVLGVVDGDFALLGDDLADVARQVVDRLLDGGGELLTVVPGAEAPAGLAHGLTAYVRRTRPLVESVVVDGGQPRYPLLLGVE